MNSSKNKISRAKNESIRIAYLEKACQWNLFSLDLIASLGDMHCNALHKHDIDSIFSSTRYHIERLISFNAIAFFNIDESDSSFIIASCDPDSKREMLEKTVDHLIENGTFAWALNQNRPIVVKRDQMAHTLVLHVLSTRARIRGMFIGVLTNKKHKLTDASLSPLSVILHYTANALESAVHCKMISGYNQNLQEVVQKQTEELKNKTAKLRQEIIERKHTEVELMKYRNHLEELVEDRTAQLKSTHEQLVHAEKLAAIGKLSASIAHEFNNPICGIHNVLERIGKKVPMDETNKDLLDIAIRECGRITDLIRKLHDFYRPSAGIIVFINIHTLIEEVLKLSQEKLNRRRIKLEKNYASNMPEIQVIPDQIKQVILNIFNNAEEAIPKSGGTIKITTEAFDSKIKIHIQDTGGGISEENRKSIFEPFFTTKSAVKGTGLGLSISYGIIKRHGGEIEVESTAGEETTFTISLLIKGIVEELPDETVNLNF